MQIKFVDLHRQYVSIKSEIDKAISNVIAETAFIKSNFVMDFEIEFARKYGINHCIGVGNGTDAIYILLKMLDIGSGDEVITTAHSWISTSETITQAGAKPVFVDVDEYFTIDVNKIGSAITSKTRAIIPVHLYGQPCDMDAILKIASLYDLLVIEDCAQAHFADYRNKKVGTFGVAATFSFYPGKNLGAYGDAGAIITDNNILAEKCRMYANHGAIKKHHHEIEGINSRLDGLQAAILTVKLKYIDDWNKARFKNALRYNDLLGDIPQIKTPLIRNESSHIFHVYCLLAEKRDRLQNYLLDNGIESQIHYPTVLPLMPAYKYLGYKKQNFPISESNQFNIISLPMFPELSEEEIKYICDCIRQFYG